jgi:hypothetical protein
LILKTKYVMLDPINILTDRKNCNICGERLTQDTKEELYVRDKRHDMVGGYLCSDCWGYIIELAYKRKADFIHNKIMIKKRRDAWKTTV